MAWNILQQSHVFIYDEAWNILEQRHVFIYDEAWNILEQRHVFIYDEAWNILEQRHVFIYDEAWNILGQRVLYKLALFILNMLKLIIIIYALILLVNIGSDVRCINTRNYPPALKCCDKLNASIEICIRNFFIESRKLEQREHGQGCI